MKQFIVLAAVLPIMLVFIAQFSLEAGRNLKMNAAENAIRSFCVEAAYYEGGGPAQAEALRSELARIFGASAHDVVVDLTRPDDAHINWFVSFPVGKIMAGARLMGLSSSENNGRAKMSGTITIAKEPEPPAPPEEDDEEEENADNTENVDKGEVVHDTDESGDTQENEEP